ncbi:MAG TPA: DUF922 domain-containing protein [Bacteroidetes bacterium]|nr:DUF922 domain-containing protein [Bacteroidota bacterium]
MKRIFQFQFWKILVLLLLAVPMFGFGPARVSTEEDVQSEIRWRKSRKLNWDDFQGQAVRGMGMDALTESGISFSWTCGYRGFEFNTYAMFVPEKSWVRQRTPALLAHEQLHFDITELHARKIRKFFRQKGDVCRLGQRAINAAAQAIIRASTEMQNLYDRETRHSENEAEQSRWQQEVARALRRYDAWAE